MKKAILNMKAFYISLFVVLFFPLGLMGQTPVAEQFAVNDIICLETTASKYIMSVDVTITEGTDGDGNSITIEEYNLSAVKRTDNTVFGNMNIWWEVTPNNKLKHMQYGCYLKLDLANKIYVLTTNENEAVAVNYINSWFSDDTWGLGSESWSNNVSYSYSYQYNTLWWNTKTGTKTYDESGTVYFRPEYKEGKWVAGHNLKNRQMKVEDVQVHMLDLAHLLLSQRDHKITSNPIPNIKIIEGDNPSLNTQAYKLDAFSVARKDNVPLDDKGLQAVHTFTDVIYAKPYSQSNAYVHLRLQVEDTKSYPITTDNWVSQLLGEFVDDNYLNGYYRWFNYDEESDVTIINSSLRHIKRAGWLGTDEADVYYFETNQGDVLLKNQSPGKTLFEMGTKRVKIACDVSNFSDYNISYSDALLLKEPTLSYRMIYDIRPASEMAIEMDKIKNTNQPFESYNIVAPAGESVKIGPKYRCSGMESNYFYNYSSSSGTTSQLRTPKLRRYNKSGEQIGSETELTATYFTDYRLFSVTVPSDGQTEIYKLYNSEKNIILAEFRVTGRAKEKVGPFKPVKETDFIHFPDYINEDYLDLEYNQTFDFSDQNIFNDPLPWSDISYGFVYYYYTGNKKGRNEKINKTRCRKSRSDVSSNILPHWSEYSFIQNTTAIKGGEIFTDIHSHSQTVGSSKTDGFDRFLYCSGTSTPSKVADFVINGNLCPASKIFLSAWVVHTFDVSTIDQSDMSSLGGGVYPNLNFSIIGIMKDGTETPISTFTTGDMKTNPGKWHHILFEFETTQVDYDQYRIRIENNNASLYNIGNEFGIDDIRVYTTTKTAATVNQKFMGCPTWDVNNPTVIGKSNIALLRADLSNTPSEKTIMYYSWLKSEGVNDTIHLQLENYLGTNTIGGSHTLYGDVEVNKDWTDNQVPAGRLYATVDAYLSAKAADLQVDVFADYFFTREDGDLVLYIVHKDTRFKQNEKYYSLVTADRAKVEEHNTPKKLIEFYQNLQCGSLSYFEVLPYSRAFLAKQEGEVYKKYGDYDFTEAITKHLAEGETYNFVVEAYSPAAIDGRDTIVSYNCAADWLLVMNDEEKWKDAQKIIDWRDKGDAQPSLSNTLKTPNGSVTSFSVENFSGPLHYIAIPNPKVAVNGNTPCAIPVEIYLYDSIPATLADPEVSEATDTWKYDRPAAICNEPIIVRIPNSLEGKDNFTLNLDIDYFDEYLFAEIAKYNAQEGNTNLYPLNNIYLYDANGQPVATPIKFNITTTAKDENNQTLTLDLLKKDDDVTISGGHAFASGQKYHFAGHNVVNGVKITPPFQFDVYVVPDEVEWTGDEDKSTAWHKDANWNPAFIPMSHTNVVIPGNTVNKPVLNPAEGEFESGANQWLEHDIVLTKNEKNVFVDNTSAVLNSCKDIYFEAGAELANQHMLNYERAFVDVPFTGTNFGKSNDNFKIMSFPLRNVYRGDLYIPKAGDGTFAFASPADVDNRAYNSFHVKAYNSAIQKNTISGDKTKPEAEKVVEVKDYTYESTGGWSNPTSVLNFEFEEAHGYAVSLNANTNTKQSFVRLPKSATEYYLFMNFGNGNEKPLHGSTWPKYEISWEADDEREEAHDGREFAHKLVYDKDHVASVTFTNKVGNIFLIGNPFMTDMNVKRFLAGNTNLNSTVYYTYIDGTINVNVTPKETDVIPPFGAMFVKGKTDNVKQTFEFTPEMMSYTESSASTQQRAPRMVEERELLTITAEVDGARSRTYIEKDFAANNEYLDIEDADLLVLDADLTPISVYSVATGAALAYNSVTDMEFVPLGLLLVDSTIVAESVRFTFDGVDYFYDELYLYDALYNSYLPLIDGVALELEMPESGELRYFITDTKHNVGGGVTTSDDLVEGSKVCVFTTEGEACIIAEDIISEATVYDIAGRLIYYSDQIFSSQHNISLPNGVYMLKVVVNSDLSTHKIILK